MTDQRKSSRGQEDRCGRRRNAFRKLLKPVFGCMAWEKQGDATDLSGMPSDQQDQQRQVCSSDHDVIGPKEQCVVDKDHLSGDNSASGTTIDDVTILDWGRFSNVYRHGLPIMLGEGDEGYVMLMRDNQTKGLVAVKTWHNDPATDISMMTDNFNFEVSALKRFNGAKYFPHLIGILPNTESGVNFSLVQEFIGDSTKKRSVSLLDAIHDRELTREGIITNALEVTDALAEMHSNGWLHCDVKIDNVMLQRDDQSPAQSAVNETTSENGWWINEPSLCESVKGFHAKLIDFGGARPISQAKLPKKLPKKMKKYMYQMCPHIAPEVVEGRGKVPYSYASDVYSLGQLLKDLSVESGITDLEQIAKRCLAKKAKKRPSIESVAEELKAILSSLQTCLL